MRKFLFIVLLLLLGHLSRSQNRVIDSIHFKIAVLYDTTRLPNAFSPEDSDLITANEILNDAVRQYNSSDTSSKKIQLRKHYRQYLGYIEGGKKQVFVVCFLPNKLAMNREQWKSELATYNSTCYFVVTLDFSQKTCSDFKISNGECY